MLHQVAFSSSGSSVQGYFFPSYTAAAGVTAIFLQGFPGTEGDELICEQLARAGVNVFAFNYRGTFGSDGVWSFSNAVADIGAALEFLQTPNRSIPISTDTGKIVLGGWSFGSGILPAGAAQNPDIRQLFMISGRNFGEEARRVERDPVYAAQVRSNLEALRSPAGPLRFKDDFIEDLIASQDVLDHAKLAPSLTDRDILLIGGWADDISPIETCTIPFYRSLVAHGARYTRIEAIQDGHEFSSSKDQLVRVIVDWLQESTNRNVNERKPNLDP